jgi:hypothetical protein
MQATKPTTAPTLAGEKSMSHFYRLHTVNDYTGQSGIGVDVAKTYRPSGKNGSLPTEWRRALLQDEVPLDPPWPHCKMLRAPLMPPGFEQEYYVFILQPGVEVPDIWASGDRALVSERAKAVLQVCDDFGHEFIETEIQNEQQQRINKEPYYLLNVRRILEIDESYGRVVNWESMFYPDAREDHYLPCLQEHSELKDRVAQLPMWRHFMNESVIYLSESVLQALRNAGLTGLKDYSNNRGEPGEAIARFE